MITVASIVLGLFAGLSVAAAQPTPTSVNSEGTCRAEVIQRALETAPGIDEGSPATVVEVRLLSVAPGAAGVVVETYFVKTEDQGGTAASNITVRFRAPSFIPQLLHCEILNQEWVE